VDMPLGKPAVLAYGIDSTDQIAHLSLTVTHKSVTSRQIARSRYAEVPGTCPAGVRTVGTPVDFMKSVNNIHECITLATQRSSLKLQAAVNHSIEEHHQIMVAHLALT